MNRILNQLEVHILEKYFFGTILSWDFIQIVVIHKIWKNNICLFDTHLLRIVKKICSSTEWSTSCTHNSVLHASGSKTTKYPQRISFYHVFNLLETGVTQTFHILYAKDYIFKNKKWTSLYWQILLLKINYTESISYKM